MLRMLVLRLKQGMRSFSSSTKSLKAKVPVLADREAYIASVSPLAEVYFDWRVGRLLWLMFIYIPLAVWNIYGFIVEILSLKTESLEIGKYLSIAVYVEAWTIIGALQILAYASVVILIWIAALSKTYDASRKLLHCAYFLPLLVLVVCYCIPYADIINPTEELLQIAVSAADLVKQELSNVKYRELKTVSQIINFTEQVENLQYQNKFLVVINDTLTSLTESNISNVFIQDNQFMFSKPGDNSSYILSQYINFQSQILYQKLINGSSFLSQAEEIDIKQSTSREIKNILRIFFVVICIRTIAPYTVGLLRGSVGGFDLVLTVWDAAEKDKHRVWYAIGILVTVISADWLLYSMSPVTGEMYIFRQSTPIRRL